MAFSNGIHESPMYIVGLSRCIDVDLTDKELLMLHCPIFIVRALTAVDLTLITAIIAILMDHMENFLLGLAAE